MEEPQNVIDVMNLHITHNLQFLGSFNSCRNQFNQVQANDLMITQHEQQQQWHETIDPLKLVLGKVIGRGSYGVVYKGSYHGQTVAGKTNSLVCYLLVEFKGALCKICTDLLQSQPEIYETQEIMTKQVTKVLLITQTKNTQPITLDLKLLRSKQSTKQVQQIWKIC
ncbi:putative kinase-like domain superfamily, kinase, ATP binding protein [Helianthus anomalus]